MSSKFCQEHLKSIIRNTEFSEMRFELHKMFSNSNIEIENEEEIKNFEIVMCPCVSERSTRFENICVLKSESHLKRISKFVPQNLSIKSYASKRILHNFEVPFRTKVIYESLYSIIQFRKKLQNNF